MSAFIWSSTQSQCTQYGWLRLAFLKICVFISKKEPCQAMFPGIEWIIPDAIELGEEKSIPLFWRSRTREDSAVRIHSDVLIEPMARLVRSRWRFTARSF